VHSILVKFVTY